MSDNRALPYLTIHSAAEEALITCKEIEHTLSNGETKYVSPLLSGLVFSKEVLTFRDTQNTLERYYNILTTAKPLRPYHKEKKFTDILQALTEEFPSTMTYNNCTQEVTNG